LHRWRPERRQIAGAIKALAGVVDVQAL